MSIKNKASQFAHEAHKKQKRRDGMTPYIVHPLALVALLESWGIDDEEILAAAHLHDVLEDSEVTEDEMEAEFGKKITAMVRTLSHRDKEDYPKYIERIAKTDSVLIKIADIIMNLSDDPTPKQVKKYSEALKVLIPIIADGAIMKKTK